MKFGEACQWASLFYKYPVLFNYITVLNMNC